LDVSLSTSSAVKGVPLTITMGGSDTPFDSGGDTPSLYALVRPANGVACQPTFGDDQQVAGSDSPTVLYSRNGVPDGNFSQPESFTPGQGAYIVCAWLETDSDDYGGKGDVPSQVVEAAATTDFSAANTDTLSISLSTTSAVKGVPLTITMSGSDTPFDSGGDTPSLYALVRPATGVPCQPTFGQDEQVAGSDSPTVLYSRNSVPDGNFSQPESFTPDHGSYVVCAWLESDSDDYGAKGDVASQVVSAAGTATFAVGGASPPPAPTKQPPSKKHKKRHRHRRHRRHRH
jgi:hypothetical protein